MDGQDFLFDETYPHFARNDSNQPRLILMCDVERPMYLAGRVFNSIYRRLAGLTVVPNTSEDERGFASAAFASLAPLLARSKALKQSNRALYKFAKVLVSGTLISILLLALIGIVKFTGWLLS